MTKRDYKTISAALDRILFGLPDKRGISEEAQMVAAGCMLGFKMWFEEYAKENVEI